MWLQQNFGTQILEGWTALVFAVGKLLKSFASASSANTASTAATATGGGKF